MSGQLINALLQATSKVIADSGPCAAAPGQPYARESPVSPFEFNAAITISTEEGKKLEFLLSCPAEVLDAIAGIEGASEDQRLEAMAERARAIADHAAQGACVVEKPRVFVGADVMLDTLRSARRRICMPWVTPGGQFVTEAGAHI